MNRKHTARNRVLALVGMGAVLLAAGGCSTGGSSDGGTVTLNVAIAANPDPKNLQKLIPEFEKANPGIKINITALDEVTLRDKLAQSIPTESGEFDVVMAGMIDAPQWARNGWVENVEQYAEESKTYDVDDLLPAIRNGLSVDGELIGVPFTGESSFIYYRKDLFDAAGLKMPDEPTWDQIQEFAATLTDRPNNLAGICLRGQAGWGSNMPTIINLMHAYGGHVVDKDWNPGFSTPEAKRAVQQYADMITESGELGAANSSFQECQNLFNQGQVAMWYDATSVAPTTFDPASSAFADVTAVTNVPAGDVNSGGWLWSWAFVMLKASEHKDAAWKFMEWATSKDYIDLAGKTFGWNLVPPGTRTSTYENPDYLEGAAAYADLTLSTINTARTEFEGANDLERASWVDVPEWPATGDNLGKIFSAVVAGDKSVDDALAEADAEVQRMIDDAGYAK